MQTFGIKIGYGPGRNDQIRMDDRQPKAQSSSCC